MDLLHTANKALRRVLVARGVRSSFARVGEHRVHYYELKGSSGAAPLLLVHGLGGSANGFSRTLFGLARRFGAVYALDLPGNGFSPLPSGGPLPALDLVPLLAGFCEEVVRGPAFVVGNSLGGALTAGLGYGYPGLVRAIGLVAPAGARVADERLSSLLRAMTVESPAEARELTRRLFHRAPLPALWLSSQLMKMYGSPAVRHFVASAKPSDCLPPDVLSALSMPTLLLWGQSEKLLPYESIDYFRAHLPPHAEIHIVEGFGHVPQMERPDELVRRLVRFADRHGL